MIGRCILAADINQCQHYTADGQICKDGPETCGFRKQVETEQPQERQPEKWFEKYMK